MQAGVALVTGFPALRGRHVVEALSRDGSSEVVALVHPDRSEEAEKAHAQLPPEARARVSLLSGDPAAMDFGLSGDDYSELAARVEVVHAAYSILDAGASAEACERVNVGAAREVLELGRAGRGLRVVLYSSVFVSGNRSGRIFEHELEAGQSFRSAAERTLATAERMLKRSGLPLSVVRAGHLLGDATTGAVEQLSGLHALVALLANAPDDRPLSLPSAADTPLPLTPVDRLAALGVVLGRPDGVPKVLHALDFVGVTLRGFLERCASAAGRQIEPGFHPTSIPRALIGNPGTRLLPQSARGILEVLTTSAEYDTRQLSELIAAGAPSAPPLESYIGPLVDYVRARSQDGNLVTARRAHGPWLVA